MNEIFTSATIYLIRKDSNIKFLISSQSVLSPGVSECVYLLYMFVYYNVSVFSKLWLRLRHSFGGGNLRGYKCSGKENTQPGTNVGCGKGLLSKI